MILRSTLAAALSLPLVLAACAPGGAITEGSFKDLDSDCVTCLESLAECSSTARTERQFVECRDVFGDCQIRLNLGPKECGRPNNQLACELCQDRARTCDGPDCEEEFAGCKDFLMTRAQESCSKDAAPELGDCSVCVEALASCAFAGDQASVCDKIFLTCRTQNQIDQAVCPSPTVDESCAACDAKHEACEAAAGEGCDAGWSACVAVMATEGACGAGPSETEPPACTHDACTAGEKMSATCDSCVAAVCDLDPFCCDVEYDDLCVSRAQNIAECGCAPVDTCAHDVCSVGVALEPGCNECATQVCEQDGYCCNTEWDDLCVSIAASSCGSCG